MFLYPRIYLCKSWIQGRPMAICPNLVVKNYRWPRAETILYTSCVTFLYSLAMAQASQMLVLSVVSIQNRASCYELMWVYTINPLSMICNLHRLGAAACTVKKLHGRVVIFTVVTISAEQGKVTNNARFVPCRVCHVSAIRVFILTSELYFLYPRYRSGHTQGN
jgi:hypothetical protein